MNLGTGGGSGGMGQPQIDWKQTKPVICECGNFTFTTGMFLREVSALLSPNGKAGIVPLQTVVCNACGRVPDQMVPSFLKEAVPTPPEEPVTGYKKSNLTLLD